jgi:hypothetical protein
MTVGISAAHAQAVAPTFISPSDDPAFCGSHGAQCFDSKWVAATNGSTKALVIPHNLGTTPRFVSIFFSPTGDDSRVFPLTWSWSAGSSGNPVTIEVTDKQVLLHIYADNTLHGVFDANSGNWHTYSTGSFRVFARK